MPMNSIPVLLIEDDAEDASLVENVLAKDTRFNFSLTWKDRLDKAIDYLATDVPHVILIDLSLPTAEGDSKHFVH